MDRFFAYDPRPGRQLLTYSTLQLARASALNIVNELVRDGAAPEQISDVAYGRILARAHAVVRFELDDGIEDDG